MSIRRLVPLVLAAMISPALAQQAPSVWETSTGADASAPGRTVARLSYGTPPATPQFLALCAQPAPGTRAATVVFGADIGALAPGQPAELRVSGGGTEATLRGTAHAARTPTEPAVGVTVPLDTRDPVFAALAERDLLYYQVPGRAPATLDLRGGRETIRRFVETCRALEAGIAAPVAQQAPPPIVAAPVPVPAPGVPGAPAANDAAEREAFAAAERIGTPAAWQAFLQHFPSGFRADLARAAQQQAAGGGGAPAGAPPAGAPPVAAPVPLAASPPAQGAAAPPIPLPPLEATGLDVTRVRTAQSDFEVVAARRWEERAAAGARFTFEERARTPETVTLNDPARGLTVVFDLPGRTVNLIAAGAPPQKIADILAATAGPVPPPRAAPAAVPVPVPVPSQQRVQQPPPRREAAPPRERDRPRTVGCEEGYRYVDGRCRRIRAGERPQGCPPGTRPIPETDACEPIRQRTTGCEEGYRFVDGRCRRIRSYEEPQGCPPGTRPVPETDDCAPIRQNVQPRPWPTDRNGFEVEPWRKPGCGQWKRECDAGRNASCARYESTCQVN